MSSVLVNLDAAPQQLVAIDASGNFSYATTLPLDGSADGTHVLHFKATDFAGNSQAVDSTFTLDTKGPSINVNVPAAGATLTASPTISGRVSDAVSGAGTLQEQLDGGSLVSVPFDASGEYSFAAGLASDGTADGLHTVHFTASDKAGNSTNAEFTFTLDTRGPSINVTAPAAGSTVTTSPTISGKVSDAVSGAATLQEELDGGSLISVPFDASGNYSFPLGLASDGVPTARTPCISGRSISPATSAHSISISR